MPQIIINPISQEFIKEADDQLKEIEEINPDNVLSLLNTFNRIEHNLKCALYTGDNNACYKLARAYDSAFNKLPYHEFPNTAKQESRDAIVLAGRKLGIKECEQINLIFNPQKPTEDSINTLISTIQTVQIYFSDKPLINTAQTKKNIIERYYQVFDEISEKQHFKSIKEITGTVLECANDEALDYINNNDSDNLRYKLVKPILTYPRSDGTRIYVYDTEDGEQIQVTLRDFDDKVEPIGETSIATIVNNFFSM